MTSRVLLLFTGLCLASLVSATAGLYAENLLLEPLPHNSLLASFNFRVRSHRDSKTSLISSTHYAHLPRSLGQILSNTHTHELHLRLTQGRWDEDWGSLPSGGQMAGGTGMEIWAWIDDDHPDTYHLPDHGTRVDWNRAYSRWVTLTNALAGLFCASLNFVDSTRTISPALSFRPAGHHPDRVVENLHSFHGALPREPVCTENLTPFLKLLPCKGRAGISSLLDGHRLFDSQWQAMALDVRPVCEDDECYVEMIQNVDMVIDVERSIRHSPIPRPQALNQLRCDQTKPYASDDVCFPVESVSNSAFSIEEIFGRPIRGACPVAQAGNTGHVHVQLFPSMKVEPQPDAISDSRFHYTLTDKPFHLQVTFTEDSVLPAPLSPPLSVSRWLTGHGQERGGLQVLLKNSSPRPQEIVYLESLPWFMKPYLHTLTATVNVTPITPSSIRYRPAIDRLRGTQLEVLLSIPANSTLSLTWEFDKSILRYTEYPPDANRGFDVAPAVITVLDQGIVLRTPSLLLSLPTPDFSMPYNVIILSSTVIALAFGSIFNLLVRRFVALEPGDVVVGNKLRGLVLRLIAVVKAKIERARGPPIKRTTNLEKEASLQ